MSVAADESENEMEQGRDATDGVVGDPSLSAPVLAFFLFIKQHTVIPQRVPILRISSFQTP